MRERTSRSTTPTALTAIAVAGVLLLPAVPALGHAVLLETDPADGAIVDGAPGQVALVFSERMQQPSTVTVTGPDGETVGDGEAEIDGDRALVPLEGVTVDGVYTVAWRVVSADGHPVTGEFTFEVVGADAPAGEPTPTPEPAATPGDESAQPEPTPGDEPAAQDDETMPEDAAAATAPAGDDGASTLLWLLAGAAALAAVVAIGAGVAARRGG